MPARTNKAKGSATPRKTSKTATPDNDSRIENGKKRKIDWATIDDTETFQGFKLKPAKAAQVKTPKNASPAHKKSKPGKAASTEREEYRVAPTSADIVTPNPFEAGQLSETHYKVDPAFEWESTQRYRKFTISDAEFEVGQIVFVKTTEEDFDPKNSAHFAFGRVLEVRAGDASHVFLRIYYLYRPEELPEGRQPHHGEMELIASNHMDIIEALTVSDRAEVTYWNEDPEKSEWPMKDQYFWRQTYDIGKPKTQQFSKLRSYCKDKAPCNPNETLVNCPSCSEWLHAHCLEEQAVEDAYVEHNVPTKGRPAKRKKKGARRSSTAAESFTARLTTQEPGGQVCLTVTDERPEEDKKRWNVDVTCLLCKAIIEPAANLVPKPEAPAEVTKVIDDVVSTPEPAEEEDDDSVIPDTDLKSDDPGSEIAAPDPFLPKAAAAVPNGETTVEPIPA